MSKTSFKDMFFQNESKAEEGDWEGANSIILQVNDADFTKKKTKFVVDIKLDDGGEYKLLKEDNTATYYLGYFDEETIQTKQGEEIKEKFKVIMFIKFSKEGSLGHKLGNNKLYNVDEVGVTDALLTRRRGIAKTVYKYFVKEQGWEILGDSHQYFGARRLWSRLSKELDVQVDLVDIQKKVIIEENVILHHGRYDEDFDERLWSRGEDKLHIRPILKKILKDYE